MSSIREVAGAAGVSVATVSRVLSNPEKVASSTRKKVQKAIDELNYRPNMLARNFRSARSYSLLVLVPDISNPFFALVIRAIEDRAQQKGYSVLLGDTRDSARREQDYMRLAETRLADGVIQLRPHSLGDAPSSESLGFPCINLCGAESTPAPSIRVDNVRAAEMVVEHLVALGHRRIGVITGLQENVHTQDRFQGYRQGLSNAGLKFEPKLVVEGNFSMPSGQNAGRQFAEMKQPPTAIFCMNDEMAIGASQGLKAYGLSIPEQVSIVGFDDIDYAKYNDPPLTTIAQPAEAMGTIATDLLLQLIDGQTLSRTEYVLPFEFILRDSTGPANS